MRRKEKTLNIQKILDLDKSWILGLKPKQAFIDTPGSLKWYTNQLTEEDWERIKKLVKDGYSFIRMASGVYSYELELYEHAEHISLRPSLLVVIPHDRLPASLSRQGQEIVAQQIAEELTHSSHNLEVLKFYSMSREQQSPGFHCY